MLHYATHSGSAKVPHGPTLLQNGPTGPNVSHCDKEIHVPRPVIHVSRRRADMYALRFSSYISVFVFAAGSVLVWTWAVVASGETLL